MKKGIYFVLASLAVVLLLWGLIYCTYIYRDYYNFPRRDFDVTIPLSVKNYYDADTVFTGIDVNLNKVLALQVTEEEFQKYVGHFPFQKIDTTNTEMKM